MLCYDIQKSRRKKRYKLKEENMKTWIYIVKRFGLYLLILFLLVFAFLLSMDYMTVNTLLKDSFLLRAKVVMQGEDESELTNVFSKTFLQNDAKLTSTIYDNYNVLNFIYEMDVNFTLIFPWQNEVKIIVTERVPYIDGELLNADTSNTNDDSQLPQWQDGIYLIALVRSDGNWKITKMETLKLLDKEETITQASPIPSESAGSSVSPSASTMLSQ